MQTRFFFLVFQLRKSAYTQSRSSCSNPTIHVYSTYSRTANFGTKIQPENMSQLNRNCHAAALLFRLNPMTIESTLDKSNHSRRRTLPLGAQTSLFLGLPNVRNWKESNRSPPHFSSSSFSSFSFLYLFSFLFLSLFSFLFSSIPPN